MPRDVLGYSPHIFHWQVPPRPISVSDTDWPLTPRDTQGPMAPDTFSSRDVCKMQHNLTQCQYTTQLAPLAMSAKYSTILLSASIPHNLQLLRCLQNAAQSYSVPAYHTTCSSRDVCKMQHNLTQCQYTTLLAALATSAKCSTILLSASIQYYLQLSQCLQSAAQSYSVPAYHTISALIKSDANTSLSSSGTIPPLHCPVAATPPSQHFTAWFLPPSHHFTASLSGSCHHPTTSLFGSCHHPNTSLSGTCHHPTTSLFGSCHHPLSLIHIWRCRRWP